MENLKASQCDWSEKSQEDTAQVGTGEEAQLCWESGVLSEELRDPISFLFMAE